MAERAAAILDWLSQPAEARAANWAEWRGLFLNASGETRGDTALVNKVLLAGRPELLDRYKEEAARILAVDDSRRALRLAAVSDALATLAGPVVSGYTQRKEAAGLLDYDDLIDRTRTLLFDPGAAWVLYKLDGGLDHLLLDEVQDTAPQQWRIAHALTEEFFAGAGRARPHPHGVRGRRPQAVDLLVPGRRRGGVRPLARSALQSGCGRPARCSRESGWTCRSAPPRRCCNWWMRCSPIRWRGRASSRTARR